MHIIVFMENSQFCSILILKRSRRHRRKVQGWWSVDSVRRLLLVHVKVDQRTNFCEPISRRLDGVDSTVTFCGTL